MSSGKVIDDQIFKILPPTKFDFFDFVFTMYTKKKCSQLKKKIGTKRPKSLVL